MTPSNSEYLNMYGFKTLTVLLKPFHIYFTMLSSKNPYTIQGKSLQDGEVRYDLDVSVGSEVTGKDNLWDK